MVERRTHKPKVKGSIPFLATKFWFFPLVDVLVGAAVLLCSGRVCRVRDVSVSLPSGRSVHSTAAVFVDAGVKSGWLGADVRCFRGLI